MLASAVIGLDGLAALLGELATDRTVIGPTVRDGAIVLDHIDGVHDLPAGWTDEQEAGHYRLRPRADGALFGWAVGAHSWRQLLFPRARACGGPSRPAPRTVRSTSSRRGPRGRAPLRVLRGALVRPPRHRDPRRGVPPGRPPRPDLPRPARGRVRRRRPLQRAGQHVLLHVHGHWPAGARWLRPRPDRAARRAAARAPRRSRVRAGRRRAAAAAAASGRRRRPRGVQGDHRAGGSTYDPRRADRGHP